MSTRLPSRRPGWTLPQPYFTDEAIYRHDLERIWRAGWIFAGHTCEIPEPGMYFTVPVDQDSVLVVRDRQGGIRAHHNVCRHRGSTLCDASAGRVHRFVCPYHQWTYDLDGTLTGWRGMQDDLDKADFPLISVAVEELEGLIFISLADRPAPFAEARRCLAGSIRVQGLRRAKVAKCVDYLVGANWKVIWENNRECFHCNVNHPQYIQANFDHFNPDDATPRIKERMAAAAIKLEARRSVLATETHDQTGMTLFPDPERGIWFSCNRTPLVENWVSESMDGQQVAPLMGDYPDPDVGTLRIRTLPNFWNHSSCDHAVSTRLLPAGPEQTAIRVWWLVHADAVEGDDYVLEKLMPFWQLTSEQDWEICERQQRGIRSSAYRPGPYSTHKEYNVERFVKWYLKSVE